MADVDLAIRGGMVVTPDGPLAADVAADGGRIVAIAAHGRLGATGREEVDASGLHVLPGVIDGHVHFREPGLEHKEDWETGSRSAVTGGVTTVLDMPNVTPPTASLETAEAKRRLVEGRSWCDFGFFGVVLQDNVPEIARLAGAGAVVGFKVFLGTTVGNIPAPDDGMLLEALAEIRRTGLRVGFHAENDQIVQHGIRRLKEAGRTDPRAHLESRPAIAEVEAIQRVCLFARHTGAKVHVFHLSSRDGLETLGDWRARGVDVTTETGAHFCFLTVDEADRVGNVLKMNPPIRAAGHGDELLAGIVDGRIESIATDHSPHTLEEKTPASVWDALSGFAGVEVSLRLFLTLGVHAGRMTLPQLVRATSEGPARTWGLWPRKGAIRIGSDADLALVDLDRPGRIEAAALHGRSNTTPFEGRETRGAVVATVLRGRVVMRDGALVGEPSGRLV